MTKFRTAESVTEGHPDKMADLVSDTVLDAYLEQDPHSRVACETLLDSSGTAVVSGEITSRGKVNIEPLVYGVWPECKRVLIDLQQQSQALSHTVASGGANDQGVVIGYACNETAPHLMPLPISLAHSITKLLSDLRKNKELPYLRSDGKAQVTVCYNEKPTVKSVVISSQHSEETNLEVLRADLKRIVTTRLPMCSQAEFLINCQRGRFETSADTGLTGRKIVMDAYGPQVPNGGGAFSGKDPSKLDRSAAYMLRHIAKKAVYTSLAKTCLIEAAYCIGITEPVAVSVNTFGTGDEKQIEEWIKTFPLTPDGIIEYLQLRRPIYKQTATNGHFGKDNLPWEKLK